MTSMNYFLLFIIAIQVSLSQDLTQVNVGTDIIRLALTKITPLVESMINKLGQKGFDYPLINFSFIQYQLNDISFDPLVFSFPDNFNFEIDNNSDVILTVTNLKVNLKSSTYYKLIYFITNQGTLDANLVLNMKLKLKVDLIENNIDVDIQTFEFDYSDSTISLQGGFLNSILNRFLQPGCLSVSVVEGFIEDILKSKLSTMPNNFKLTVPDTNQTLGITLNQLIIQSNSVDLGLKFDFPSSKAISIENSLNYYTETVSNNKDGLMLKATEDLINNVLNLLYQANLLKFPVHSLDAGKLNIKLNTYALSMLIPKLYADYPNQDFYLEITFAENPVFTIDSTTQQISSDPKIKIHFIETNTPNKQIFELEANLLIVIKIKKDINNKLDLIIDSLEMDNLIDQTGGISFPVQQTKEFFNVILKYLTSSENYSFSKGLSLNQFIPKLDFTYQSIKINDSTLEIDLTVNPNA